MREGRLSAAERDLRRLLELQPENRKALRSLARVLELEGRHWESVPVAFQLLRHDQCDVQELVLLGGAELLVDMPAQFLSATFVGAHDPRFLMWRALEASHDRDLPQVEALLRQVLVLDPGQIEAQARLGSLLLESGDERRWLQWHEQLPAAADDHPQIWAVRGIWSQNHETLGVAARCFWEAVRRDPDHRGAQYHLSQVLTRLGQGALGEPFLDRARKLQELESLAYQLGHEPDQLDLLQRAAELTRSLGRLWEARAWSRAALARDPGADWALQLVERLSPMLNGDTPRVLNSANPALQADLSTYPLPGASDSIMRSAAKSVPAEPEARITFEDVAAAVGIRFEYYNSGEPSAGAMRMYEFAGGGVAVLDFDGDGWPDVHLTQGCPWPPREGQTGYLDRLYRNLGTGKFKDVTATAGVGDDRFSQGATVGDFDNDGFPDLYIANIGCNRLWHNQGDGTFFDVTVQSATGGDDWTTSCLMADLNGDGWPDIYAVNYLAGSDVFSRLCHTEAKQRQPGLCPPTTFQGQADRVYLSLGDGRFAAAGGAEGIEDSNGKGLGIVAADFEGSGKLNLFVANDAVPNFYFVNETPSAGGPLRLVDRAVTAGLAYNRDGVTQACMGVAVGDCDGNGLLDLFVTNFYQEASTLYLQQPGGYFVDETLHAGLRQPSLSMLGFGTQFLDGDLDGLPDLIVTNGHIDNYSVSSQPYQMPPQFYRNLGQGRFREQPADSLGDFFQGHYLGRGLARLDWNRDGKEDVLISHLDAPAALLSNTTAAAGGFLAVRLCGVQSDRDAIGATVRVTAGGSLRTGQLTAGDGYQASNQRQLVFGLGPARRVDQVTVRWRSGFEQTWVDLPADREILLIEGAANLVSLEATRGN